MHHSTRRSALAFSVCLAAALTTLAHAQTATPATTIRMRGNIVSVSSGSITVKDRSGETAVLVINDKTEVTEVYPIKLTEIAAGSYIGTAAMPQADGTQRAIAVTVFPEAARGRAEGHRPFDLQPASTMTNATVADVVAAPTGRTLQLKYAGGEKTVIVPPDAPVVTFRAGDRSLLVAGASVSLMAAMIDGKPTATRINAGKNGFALPY